MQPAKAKTAALPAATQAATGFKVALNILDKWGCKPEEEQAILGINRSTFYKYKSKPEDAKLTRDQLERISYVFNIHQALRVVFSNPDNIYGFMKMPNKNPYFNGKAPIDLISGGNFGNLYETYKRIDAMRGGQW